MGWYAAKLIIECSTRGTADKPLCDEQIRLIEALDAQAAYEQAFALGAEQNQEYDNPEGELVTWTFRGLGDLVELPIEGVGPGIEVWSTLYTETRAKDLIAEQEDLTVFRLAALADKTAREILPLQLRPFAPR